MGNLISILVMARFRRSHAQKAGKGFGSVLLMVVFLSLMLFGGALWWQHSSRNSAQEGPVTLSYKSVLPYFPKGEVYTRNEFSIHFIDEEGYATWFSFPTSIWDSTLSQPLAVSDSNLMLTPYPDIKPAAESILKGALKISSPALASLASGAFMHYPLDDIQCRRFKQKVTLLIQRFGGKSPEELIVSGPFPLMHEERFRSFFVALISQNKGKWNCQFFTLDLDEAEPMAGIDKSDAGTIRNNSLVEFRSCE
jgi:hypothetical protein